MTRDNEPTADPAPAELLADRITEPEPPAAAGQTIGIHTDQAHLVNVDVRSIDAVKFQVVDATIASNTFSQPAPVRLLAALLRNVDEVAWARTGGRLLCEMTVRELMTESRLGRSTVYKASGELVEKGLVEKSVGGGRDSNVYEVFPPGQRRPRSPRVETGPADPPEDSAPETSLTPRKRAPYDGSETSPGEPRQSDDQSTGVDGWRAPMSGPLGSTGVDPRRALMSGRVGSTVVDSGAAQSTGVDPRRPPMSGPHPSTAVDPRRAPMSGPLGSTQRGLEASSLERGRAPARPKPESGFGFVVDQQQVGEADAVGRLLRGVELTPTGGGEARRFDAEAVRQVAALPGISEDVVRDALAHVNTYPGKVRNPLGLLRKTIERLLGLAPPPRAAAGGPEHAQEQAAFDYEARAADVACRNADRAVVSTLTADEWARLSAVAIANEASEFLRDVWRKKVRGGKGQDSPTLVVAVARLARAARTAQPQPPTEEAPL